MRTRNFSFDLPPELVAQHPPAQRGTSRLLVLDRETGRLAHSSMDEIDKFVEPGTVMVFNDSRVRKARLYAASDHGGTVELLLIRRVDSATWISLTSKTRRQRPGKKLHLPADVTAEVVAAEGEFRTLRFTPEIDDDWLDRHGHVPLPPYIERADIPQDAERYQTVYSRLIGSVAAPTAGLHFTAKMLAQLERAGVELCFVTLHVGAGTFFPIRSEHIEDHRMHEEIYEISDSCAKTVNRALSVGRKVLAVGTTSLRCLEAASRGAGIEPGKGRTDLYIKPGYAFKTVSQLFTNFHTPQSTLLVLVSAFAGCAEVKKAYQAAVEERYRFFSYGDAMLIL
ncbi:MAG: tRNA preQ1(34) S-adenosylmethionine ribosyltransferase-isomerase QueA [Spirochaetales bacterium]|nr:tRNA preQ1(34) S-adenosylmethionine ribosyltransferase-isomerase QueA [Spirochaetales bacterium]